MPLCQVREGPAVHSRAKWAANRSTLLLVSALLSWARSAVADQDGGVSEEPAPVPPPDARYEDTVRASRQSAGAQSTVVDPGRFAGEAPSVAELLGHTTTRMVESIYSHLSEKKQYLRDQVEKESAAQEVPHP